MCASDRFVSPSFVRHGLAALLVAAAALPAAAQAPSREQEQIKRLRLQVQQLQQQAQGLPALQQSLQQAEAEQARLKQALADAQAAGSRSKAAADKQARETGAVQQQLDAARQAAEAQAAAQQALRAELDTAAKARATLQADAAALHRQLAAREMDALALASRHAEQAQGLQACITSNQALHALGQDVLQRYATQTVADVLKRDEPFLQWNRVAMENLLQGYRDKLDAQALVPATAADLRASLPTAQSTASQPR